MNLKYTNRCQCIIKTGINLTLLSLRTYGGVVLQQKLTAVGGATNHGRMIKRSETSAVLVVWRCSKVQQSLKEPEPDRTVLSAPMLNVILTESY